jgi:hypothetical protein
MVGDSGDDWENVTGQFMGGLKRDCSDNCTCKLHCKRTSSLFYDDWKPCTESHVREEGMLYGGYDNIVSQS